jgi:hypothetical protein
MSVYLGTFGEVELQRQFDGGELASVINTSDVNVAKKRFSFDFQHGQLITGDQLQIKSTDGSALDFIDSYTVDSITRYIHVDELDGVRLYTTFTNAVNGGAANAITLAAPGNDIPIKVTVQNSRNRLLAQVSSFELNTERETVDTTTLSDDFRSRINTLMSGSGRMTCFWEYTGDTRNELPHYLLELSLRTRVGSQFGGKFYIKTNRYNPSGVAGTADDEIWYQLTGVLTACAVQFSPSTTVEFTADFITTGAIEIRMKTDPTNKILQENADDILLDQDAAAKLLLETDL